MIMDCSILKPIAHNIGVIRGRKKFLQINWMPERLNTVDPNWHFLPGRTLILVSQTWRPIFIELKGQPCLGSHGSGYIKSSSFDIEGRDWEKDFQVICTLHFVNLNTLSHQNDHIWVSYEIKYMTFFSEVIFCWSPNECSTCSVRYTVDKDANSIW